MRTRYVKLLSVVGMILLVCVGCFACGGNGKNSISSLTLEDGVLSWSENKKATSYVVTLGDESVTCEKTTISFSEICKYEGEYVVTVSAVFDSGKKQIGTMEIQAKELETPAVSIVESESGEITFFWDTTEEAGGYMYDFHDGFGEKEAEIGDDGRAQAVLSGNDSTMFTLITKGTSRDNIYYIGNEKMYRYEGKMVFDLSKMEKYPFYYVSQNKSGEEFVVGTNLPKGKYNLDLTFCVTTSEGKSVTGNGGWGRRAIVKGLTGNNNVMWFCEEYRTNGGGTFGGEDTLRPADETITYHLTGVSVNKYGEFTIQMFDFIGDEMLILTDIQKDGISVMADGLKEHGEEKEVVFDVSKLNDFVAVYQGSTKTYQQDPTSIEFSIPTSLPDGAYQLELSYQIMTKDGKKLSGNGKWGRRVGGSNGTTLTWYCEYDMAPHTEGIELPEPTTTLTKIFNVKVNSGMFKIDCRDFDSNEILAVSAVKKISGSTSRLDVSKLSNNSYVYVEKNQGTNGAFKITTTLKERGLFDVEVSYYVTDINGYSLFGNGKWGRRMICESVDEVWICDTAPAERHQDAVGTLPESTQLVTKNMTVAINKYGVFTLGMNDFYNDEMVVITDVRYQGQSILTK